MDDWALRKIGQKLYDGIPHPPITIATDRELALMNAIPGVFPDVLCMWHIEKNILANRRRHFSNNDDWNDFLAAYRWHDLGKKLILTGLGANDNPLIERTTGLLLRTYINMDLSQGKVCDALDSALLPSWHNDNVPG
ncbi:hypothetical protein [Absidia glauca]|uniref:MULE transposase domain-containing protein n=1 Tax=Absidia glauca TaxID=4829 RepID=A0A163JER3_ABSGL|nr:hypothetical protein [Absidia glauca]